MGAYEADIQRFLDSLDSYGEISGVNIGIKKTKVIIPDVSININLNGKPWAGGQVNLPGFNFVNKVNCSEEILSRIVKTTSVPF